MKRSVAKGDSQGTGNDTGHGESVVANEAMRARSAATAAAKKQAEARRGFNGFLNNMTKLYKRADDVVNMPFLIVFSVVIFGFVFSGSKQRPKRRPSPGLPVDLGEGESKEWRWVQSQGKDVVGQVNCTTYMHASSGALVELGHGSGGGLSFKTGDKSKVKYVSS
jgi:hypothetical protein